MFDLTIVLVASAIFTFIYLWFMRPSVNLPPCPTRPLPFLGHLLTLEDNPRSQFKKWHQELGDIYSLCMGSKLVVVVCGYDLIKELLLKRGDEFSHRPLLAIDQATPYPQKGLIFNNCQNWKEHRALSLQILRDFGMGKNVLARAIQEEVGHFLDLLAEQRGEPTDIRVMTNVSIANVISSIVSGHRFDYDDEKFRNLVTNLAEIFEDQHFNAVLNFIPVLRYLPGDLFHIKKLKEIISDIYNFHSKFVNETWASMEEDDKNVRESFISAYMSELKSKIRNGEPTYLNKESLLKTINDLFGAGTETTNTTIMWCFLYVLHHPEVQEKIYNELQENVGTGRSPCISDKPNLTYLNAFIKESQRLASVTPQGVTHTCPRDVIVRGYTIPKGTYISPNLDSVLHDPKIWGDDVMEFKPERFIDQDGKLKTPEEFIPFSIGRRVCLGESLAVMELFLYLSSIFHRFEILPATPGSPPPIKYKFGFTVSPALFQLRAIERTTHET
ncbi:cytochrome P450 2G1-like [Physella acuta]|uniref:cytochrome P450 2G1-like n=1 Tax=Physella acuta TaxID=109671 RepID=UPI0027DC7CFD|nr:cytochrome P450 2G1-like [Physella acuta]